MPNTLLLVVHTWVCYACGRQVEQQYRVERSVQAVLPGGFTVPSGWSIHDLRPYCERHIVTVYTRIEQVPVVVVLDKVNPDAA